MATVKISELPEISHLSTNTEATLVVGVDLETGTTGKIDLTTLGEGLYAYQPLKVGENQILLSNTIGQFSGNSEVFLQVNLLNNDANGSADYVASASDYDNETKFIDMGINNSLYSDPDFSSMKPYDGYLYVHGPTDTSTTGNLVIGTASSFANIVYIVGGTVTNNIVARMTKTDLQLSAGYNIKFGDGSIQSVAASPVNYSQAAFALANNNSVLSQAAFNVANTSSANTFITQGVDASQNVRLDFSNTRMTIIEGTNASQNVRLDFSNTRMTINDGVNDTQNSRIGVVESVNFSQNTRMTIIEGTDTTQNTRLTVIEGTDVTQNTRLTDIENVNLSQNTAISATDNKMQNSYNTANNAFVKANNALANTTGTFAGDLTITGNVLTQGTISLNNSSFATNTAFVKITASDDFVTQAPSNTNYMLHITGKANSVTRVVVDSFGQNTYPLFAGRMGRGSSAAPAAVANNDVMMRIVGNGYTGSQFPPSSPSKIDFVAAENFSNTNRGTRIEFWNTTLGSNTIQKVASFNANTAEFLGEVNPLKGFIYSPVIYPGAQTAITIDMTNGPLIRAQTTSGLVVTLTNFVAGKVVELWVTNLAGSTQTFTHGVSAINSTVGTTTVTMPGNSTLSARYVCLDGTLANTMCAITKA